MINRVILTGRLTNDVELRQTNDGTLFTYFTIAVNRQGNNDTTDFVPCIAWRNQAELLKNYLGKGSLIGIEGRIEVFTTQQDGQYTTRVNVNVSQIHFLEPRKNSGNNSGNNDFAEVSFSNDGRNSNVANNNTFQSQTSNIEPNGDDVNFDDIDFENIKF